MSEIAYQLVGAGPHRVVFLHGLMGRGRNFSTIARGLGEGYTSMLIDLPNHGESAWTETFDYVEMARCVAGVIRDDFATVGSTRAAVSLVGHSMGGKVAMLVALLHPELIDRLVVVDIGPGSSGNPAGSFSHLLASLLAVDLSRVQRRSDADAQLASRIPNVTVRQFLLQNLRLRDTGYAWQPNLEMLYSALPQIIDWPQGIGAEFPGPVLWLAGEQSDYVRDEDEPRMRAMFPRLRRATIRGAGHWVHSEQPERFLATLRYFLEESAG